MVEFDGFEDMALAEEEEDMGEQFFPVPPIPESPPQQQLVPPEEQLVSQQVFSQPLQLEPQQSYSRQLFEDSPQEPSGNRQLFEVRLQELREAIAANRQTPDTATAAALLRLGECNRPPADDPTLLSRVPRELPENGVFLCDVFSALGRPRSSEWKNGSDLRGGRDDVRQTYFTPKPEVASLLVKKIRFKIPQNECELFLIVHKDFKTGLRMPWTADDAPQKKASPAPSPSVLVAASAVVGIGVEVAPAPSPREEALAAELEQMRIASSTPFDPYYHPREGEVNPEDLVGIHTSRGNYASRDTSDADKLGVVVAGNLPRKPPIDLDPRQLVPVAFSGNARVRVRGPCSRGDIVVSSRLGNGIGVVVPRSQSSNVSQARKLGCAIESIPDDSVRGILVNIGVFPPLADAAATAAAAAAPSPPSPPGASPSPPGPSPPPPPPANPGHPPKPATSNPRPRTSAKQGAASDRLELPEPCWDEDNQAMEVFLRRSCPGEATSWKRAENAAAEKALAEMAKSSAGRPARTNGSCKGDLERAVHSLLGQQDPIYHKRPTAFSGDCKCMVEFAIVVLVPGRGENPEERREDARRQAQELVEKAEAATANLSRWWEH